MHLLSSTSAVKVTAVPCSGGSGLEKKFVTSIVLSDSEPEIRKLAYNNCCSIKFYFLIINNNNNADIIELMIDGV